MEDKRRIKLISHQFQVKMIMQFVLINMFIMILFGILIYFFLNSEIETNLASAHVTFRNIAEMLFPIVLTLSMVNILISSFLIAIVVLYSSHKIAGPMYRFQKVLDGIANRDLKALTMIRKDDELKGLANDLSRVVDTFSGDLLNFRNRLSGLKTILGKIQTDVGQKEITEIENILNKYHFPEKNEF